ncbi:cyanophycinase [Adhaeribacter rhizoryzae]|uniref:Cyanophycinase n=1 Tax=Adhaeribacter rhizoryzae TaxID=2607907 RepID=A0A5M6CY94_9BACT|nr:cyanophycinase [Adhaeribacter rhizoryzae]KAA5540171.1 cyanophycinase [Adhaeribacter rhizoryzae]
MSQKNGKNVSESKSEVLTPKGILIAIGGKEDKGHDGDHIHDRNDQFIKLEILERFTKELKGKNPLIVIIPTASGEPEKAAKDYLEVFHKLKCKNVQVANIQNREDATNPDYLKLIKEAAGIIFTGGDQLKLTSILGGTELLSVLKKQYLQEPIIIAGTSAGAAAMSSGMIYEGQKDNGMFKGDVRSTSGLDFIKNVAIDTHFIARGRMIRMANRLASNPGYLGIGLEEDTGIVIKAGREAEVIGSGLIVLMDARGCTSSNIHEIANGEPVTLRNLKVDLLGKGDTFSIPDYN